jgi:hypothetical protein
MAKIDLKNTTIRLQDGDSPTPNELEIKIGEGNLTYSEKKTMEYNLDRGLLDIVREGDQVPMDVSFDFVWEFLKADSLVVPTIEEFMKRSGPAAAFVSTTTDQCQPYSVDIIVEQDPPCGGEKREIITLPDFRYEELNHDTRAGTVAVTGKCNATQATIIRAVQTT